jgi:Zn-dependent metalloprotease
MNHPLVRAAARGLALAVMFAAVFAWSASGSPSPTSAGSPQGSALSVLSSAEAGDFRAFVRKNPANWQYLADESTGRIKDVYGAVSPSYGATPQTAARGFLAANEALVNAASGDLRLASTKNGTISHLVYRQYHDGIPVEGAIVQIQVDGNGRTVWLETLADPAVSAVDTEPGISTSQAEADAARFAGLTQLPEGHPVTTLVILPGETRDRLVYKVRFSTEVPLGAWIYYVDAADGAVVSTYDELLDGTSGTVHGKILPLDGRSVPTSKDMADEYVSVAGNRTTTKSTGSYSSSSVGTVRSDMTGPWAHVENYDTSELTRSASSASWTWSYSSGSTRLDELNVFYHLNRIHDYFKGTFGVTQMDFPIKATVHYQQKAGTDYANAFYNPQTQSLSFGDGDGVNARDSAKAAEVIYHEYGHATHDHVYAAITDAGIASMQIRSMGEAWADYFSQVLTGDDEFGEWWILDPAQHRALVNTLRYPNDMQGEEHADGPIYAGALWDYRLAVGAAIADRTVVASWDYHPTDFRSGLIAMIQADKELYPSAGHETQIRAAFSGHGITTAIAESLGPLVFARNTNIAPYTAPYLYMAAADGSGARMITGTRSWQAPEWNEAAGGIYACGSDAIGNTVIYVVDPLTEQRFQLTGNLGYTGRVVAQWPSSSPTGDRVCFSWGYQGQTTMELAIVPLQAQPDPMAPMGTPVPNVDSMDGGANQCYPDWSKATNKIAYAQMGGPLLNDAYAGVWIVSPNGTGLTQLTHPTSWYDGSTHVARDAYPRWSRAGDKIAYVRSTTTIPTFGNMIYDYDIYVMRADGSDQPGTRVFQGRSRFPAILGVLPDNGLGDLSWSPADDALMFGVATGADWLGSATGYNLYRVNLNGTGLTQLTTDGGTATSCWGAPDQTPPVVSDIQVDPIYQLDRLSFSVDATDADSGILNWQYAIGSSPGATDVRLWTTVGGAKTRATATHLGLVTGRTYFVSVKPRNTFGYVAVPASSGGTLAEGPRVSHVSITSNLVAVTRRHPVSLSGVVSPAQPANTHVGVYVKTPGTKTWRLLSTRHTFGSGTWSYTYTPTLGGTYYFQARFAGTGSCLPDISSSRSVRVR